MSDERINGLYARIGKLIAYAKGRIDRDDIAYDVAHDAIADTSLRIGNIKPGAEWSYAKKTVASRISNFLTRTPVMTPVNDTQRDKSQSAEDDVLIREFQRRFAEVFNEFPEITQQIFVLKQRGETFEQIANKLHVDPTAARSRASRAAKVIRERLGDPPPGVRWLEFGDDE